MRMRFKLTNSAWLLGVLLMIAACNKDGNATPDDSNNTTPVSMVHTETYGTASISFEYNSDKTLKAIHTNGYAFSPDLAFTYKSNAILIQAHQQINNSNVFAFLDSVALNTSGRIINVRRFNADKTLWNNDHYTLNANNEIVQLEDGVSTSQKTGKHPYTYVNGNLIRDATAAVYLYDLTKAAQFGDYHSLQQFLKYGVKYNLSKNLVTGAVYGSDTTFYKYTFDASGRISEFRSVQKGQSFTQYKITY